MYLLPFVNVAETSVHDDNENKSLIRNYESYFQCRYRLSARSCEVKYADDMLLTSVGIVHRSHFYVSLKEDKCKVQLSLHLNSVRVIQICEGVKIASRILRFVSYY